MMLQRFGVLLILVALAGFGANHAQADMHCVNGTVNGADAGFTCWDDGLNSHSGVGGQNGGTGGNVGSGSSGFTTTQLSSQMNCDISKYSAYQPKYPVSKKDAWAYTDQSGTLHLYPQQFASLPPGWSVSFGSTVKVGGGPSYLYNRPSDCQAYCQTFRYIDPFTNNAGFINMPFTVFETDLLLAVHEIAHQNGVADESKANGFAAEALQNFRSANNGSACN